MKPDRSPVGFSFDFSYGRYDLNNDIANALGSDDGYIARWTFGAAATWSPQTSGPVNFYLIGGLEGQYLDANLTEQSIGIICDPWWWWCTPVAGDVIVESESTTRLGYNIGAGLKLSQGGGSGPYLEVRNHWIDLPETVSYMTAVFGYRS